MSERGVIPVGPGDEVGSVRLAAALASGDAEAIGRALRHDVVVVPLVRGADGSTQIRVLPAEDGRLELALFSSSSTLALFLRDASAREFDVQRGGAMAAFLQEHRERLSRVLFDPAGPHPVAAPVDAVIDALRPRAGDDDVGWIAGGAGLGSGGDDASAAPAREPVRRPATEVIDFRWAMPFNGWQRVVPDDLRAHPARVTAQLARSTRRLPRPQREPVAAWLIDTALAEGRRDSLRELALFAEGRGDDAFIVLAAREWLAADGSPERDFDAVVARIAAGLGGHDELVSSDDALVTPTVRHTGAVVVPDLPGGHAVIVEYLLAFPDGRGLCRARFVTPSLDDRARLQALTAPIIAGGTWVTRAPR